MVEAGAMRHRRTAVAYLLAPICLLAGCKGGSESSLGAPDQSSLSAGTSSSSPISEARSDAAASVPPSSDESAREEALIGRWVLQQVQTGNDSPRSARPEQTTLSIRGGTLFTDDACGQELQAQVTVNQSTLKLTGVIYGGGSCQAG